MNGKQLGFHSDFIHLPSSFLLILSVLLISKAVILAGSV
jgi:hypothetical protein